MTEIQDEPLSQFSKFEPVVSERLLDEGVPWKVKYYSRERQNEYYRTLVIASDVDATLIYSPDETQETITAKVNILNELLSEGARNQGLSIEFYLVTQKPRKVFFDKKTALIYGKLLNIKSNLIGDFKHPKKIESIPMSKVYCENGAVLFERLTSSKTEPYSNKNNKWSEPQVQTWLFGAGFRDYGKMALGKMMEILKDQKLISWTDPGKPDKKFPYKLEAGNFSYLSLQMPDGRPMPEAVKNKLLEQLKESLEKDTLDNRLIDNYLSFETDGQDFDIVLKKFKEMGKNAAIEHIVKTKRLEWYRTDPTVDEKKYWFGREHILMLDDKVSVAGVAAQKILESGGRAGAPNNADAELKQIMDESGVGGRVAEFPIFIGACMIIYETIYGKKMPKDKIMEINQRLLDAKNI